ncbi:MAG: radical SAM protein, partial [Hydrogenimonas sp.]|nr:radical SAM protein [Hydrogenimonas sp.]
RFSGSDEKIDFTGLLRKVTQIDGLERIRFQSPHPLHMDDEFLQEFANNPKICKQIHVPLQSGSTALLKRMKRGYTKEWFLNRCEKIRTMVPDAAISTDIIVGFPGESERDFEDTMDVLERVRFEQVFSFKYSPRPLTPAKDYEDKVPEDVASRRLSALQERHNEMLDEMKSERLCRVYEVYFEELKPGGMVAGRTDNNWLVQAKGSEELLGKVVPVKIVETSRLGSIGEIVA